MPPKLTSKEKKEEEKEEDVLFIIGDIGKTRSQKIPGIATKLGLRVQNEAKQRLIEFCQENTLVIENTIF